MTAPWCISISAYSTSPTIRARGCISMDSATVTTPHDSPVGHQMGHLHRPLDARLLTEHESQRTRAFRRLDIAVHLAIDAQPPAEAEIPFDPRACPDQTVDPALRSTVSLLPEHALSCSAPRRLVRSVSPSKTGASTDRGLGPCGKPFPALKCGSSPHRHVQPATDTLAACGQRPKRPQIAVDR